MTPNSQPRQHSVGQDRVRVDGPLKVTGTAPYAYEQRVENPAYLFALTSDIAKGEVSRIDASAALALPGVLAVLTHENAPRLVPAVKELYILQSPKVWYRNQYVGAVVAETPEIARYAASLVRVDYREEAHDAEFRVEHPEKYRPAFVNGFMRTDTKKGDVEAALSGAEVVLDEVYTTPQENHNPMEAHSMIALWDREALGGAFSLLGERPHLTVYDSTQGASVTRALLASVLGKLPGQVEIISPYVGGAFGSKGYPHAPLLLVTLAAQLVAGRPVKYMLTRQEMFAHVGYRPETHQHIRLGAGRDGTLRAIAHEVTETTGKLREYAEQTASATRVMYAAENRLTSHRLVPLDIGVGTFMRAPGEFPGMFGLETAMDELAEKLGMDPIELRVLNEPDQDPEDDKPFSTRNLVACLREGANIFGWENRPAVAERQEGEWQIGYGVAAATYPNQSQAATPTWARVRYEGGLYVVGIAASDLGTGAWTILGQIAADALDVDVEQVRMDIGSSDLPFATLAGGSTGTFTWGGAVSVACIQFRDKYGKHPPEGAEMRGRHQMPKDANKFSRHAFGAHFAEVAVSRVTGEIRVRRLLGVYAAGRIINPRTANSQLIGGMTMGLSGALHEESVVDPRFGHVVNHSLADYHIAAHADVPDIQARWLEEFDPYYGPQGAKGIGEIGVVGLPAAIGNAIYNATGKRLRGLPFTPDKLL
ncbi:xanthine dehydrogenase family protein molybdopterin-binding subunit [Deinococcus sp.]|uniref:xanthine dehydrogenase family protein molybdopterin-binding subunit n=1 Tax=Deinococcus sp. TaxID=47478 RepID=UPI0025BC8B57|nr:xanthine dehydrogenase family protein molybdopterin-binding subunit [Deinococcus sp.]